MNERKLIIIHTMLKKLQSETIAEAENQMDTIQAIIDCVEKLIANDTET